MKITDRYLSTLTASGKSPHTVESYNRVIKQFESFLLYRKTDIINVNSLTVTEWTEELTKTVGRNTVRYNLNVLHIFYEWLRRHKFIDENPVLTEDIPSMKKIEYNLLSREDIDSLIHHKPPQIQNALRNRAIIILLIYSGLRSDEIRSLKTTDLNFTEGFITVCHGKGDKQRNVPFPAAAQKAVTEYMNRYPHQGLLFQPRGKKMTSQNLNNQVKKYVFAVTGKEIHTHTLRHAFASLCDDCGIPIRTIQKALGHSSVTTTENIYVTVLNRTRAAQEISSVFSKVC